MSVLKSHYNSSYEIIAAIEEWSNHFEAAITHIDATILLSSADRLLNRIADYLEEIDSISETRYTE